MKTALAISGGGSKGAFAVGVIEVLREEGYTFDLISGTSTGSLIAPLVAIDDIDTLVELYTTITTKDIIRSNWRKLWWNALYDTKPLEKLIRKGMSEDNRYERLMQSPTQILLCAVSLQSAAITYFSQREHNEATIVWSDFDEFVRCVLASTNQPTIMPAQTIRDQQYVDGGVREITPLSVLLKTDAEQIFAIVNNFDCVRVTSKKKYNFIMSVGIATIEAMSTEIGLNDLRRKNTARTTIIRPLEPLPSDGLKFKPDEMQKMREMGQEAARRALDG